MVFNSEREPRQRLFFGVLMAMVASIVLLEPYLLWKPFKKLTGKGLNSRAWRASYRERDMPLPNNGQPREGWWGIHLSPVADPQLGFILPERHVPGMFEIDKFGRQYARSSSHPTQRIMILGGSVAAGAYASNVHRTYFNQMAKRLGQRGRRVEIIVQAAGAWTSEHELKALRYRGLALKPDFVIFLDGLNDVTLNRDKSEAERVRLYLQRMREARDLALARGIKVIFAPQPFLPEKDHKTALETLIVMESYRPVDHLIKAYTDLRSGLRGLCIPGRVFYMDCSHALSESSFTTFADIWHFSDPGHAELGAYMARKLDPILG